MDKHRFVQLHCPHPNHFCNGKHVPEMRKNRGIFIDVDRTPDLKHCCNFYVNKKCQNPNRRSDNING